MATSSAFISYRRADTPWTAAFVAALLRHRLGDGNVFLDVDQIPPGAKFRDVINDKVGSCDVLVALVGTHWVDLLIRREDGPDLVVQEIGTALRRKVPVVAVLVDGARPPGDLPAALQGFLDRQTVRLDHDTVDVGTARLIDALTRVGVVWRTDPPGPGLSTSPHPTSPHPTSPRSTSSRSACIDQLEELSVGRDASSVELSPPPPLTTPSTDVLELSDVGAVMWVASGRTVLLEVRSTSDGHEPVPADLRGAARIHVGRAQVGRVIADPESRITTELQITEMPTLVLCRKGEVVRRAVDAAGRAALLRDLDTLLD